MAVINSIPKLVSTKILRTLEKDLIAEKICTMQPDAAIKKEGDTVYFSGLADPTISDYTGSINYETLQDGTVSLLIDQKKYYAFKIDDIEAFQSNIDVKGSQVERAAYGLRDNADQYIFGLYAGAGTTITNASVTSANVLSTVSSAIRKLEENNVKPNERWMTISPWFKEKLMLAGIKFQINNGLDGEKGGLSWVNYLDTDIYVSNNIVTTGTEGSLNSKILAGSYNSIIFAKQLMKQRFIEELEDSFAGGASGLNVYGGKVLKPKELVLINATQAAESTI
jgi:hypothetical protein